MKRYVKRIGCIGAAGCLAAVLAARAQDPIEDLRVPMEYYPDGTLKAEMFAARAEVQADASIAASGVVFRLFSTNAVVEATIKAVRVLFHRERQAATSETAVSMQRGDLEITGEGCVWNGREGTLRILRQARVTFPSEMIKAEGEAGLAQ